MLIGFTYATTQRDVGAGEATTLAVDSMWRVTTLTVDAITRIFYDEQARKEVSGVVGSYEATRQSFEFDTVQALGVLALISLSLAVVNLFPFLPLDGGHIFWALAEKVRGKPIPYADHGAGQRRGLPAGRVPVHHRPQQRHRPAARRGPGHPLALGHGAHHRAEARRRRRHDRRGVPHHAPPSGEGEVAVRTKDDEVSLTWGELRGRVDALAGGLSGLGVGRGDSVALMLVNRPEFHLCDLAVMMCGGAGFSIYQTYTPEQIAFVVGDAGARVLICEQAFLPVVLEARKELPDLEHVIVIDGDAPRAAARWPTSRAPTPASTSRPSVGAIAADDVLTLIYTSGTTGPPKGVMLAHANLIAAVEGIEALIQFPHGGARDLVAAGRAHRRARRPSLPADRLRPADHLLPQPARGALLPAGASSRAGSSPCRASGRSSRPAWRRCWPTSPRSSARPCRRRSRPRCEKVRLEQAGEAVPDELAQQVAAADAQVFSGLRKMLGFDAVEAVNVGAAPTPVEVIEFFHAIGVPLAELWGMSETCGAGACNPPDRIKIGTVGPATPGVELRLADDGELLVRGGVVMTGYRNLPDKTAEAIDADGWLHTGDIAQIDDDGYVKIVDRKKEIIINAAGKNMSPANIEATLKAASPLIGQACCIGDARPVQHRADRARQRLRPELGGPARHRRRGPGGPGRRRAGPRRGAGGRRRGQRQARARRADQEVPPRGGRLAARRRRAHPDDEAQAQADRREVRGRHRGALPLGRFLDSHGARGG